MRMRNLLMAAALTALVIRACGEDDDRVVERFAHVKLAPGAGLEGEPLFARTAGELWRDRIGAMARSGRPMPDLAAWRRVPLRGSPAEIERAVARLAARPGVVSAFLAPVPELATVSTLDDGDSCPVVTPPYDTRQRYLGPAPIGIDAPAAWSRPGGRGDAIWFADVEGAWNQKHEDLPGDRMHMVRGRTMRGREWQAHGTAVVGEVAARENRLGMTGIAPDLARIVTASVRDLPVAEAIDRAQAELRPGDVLLIELHAIGPRRRFLPMEYWDDVFDAVRVATGRGVVVVAAAGNGGEDLDHAAYRGKLDRAVRDSGAILVGAGAPAEEGFVDRSRLDFSNYGGRVDVQGWGRMVATLDYGDLQGCDADGRKYTARFAGTSSAAPIAAGAAILVQSVVATSTGCPLGPVQLRALLAETGSPQTDGPHGPVSQHIGPRPDLRRAIERALATAPSCR
jgi:subtilisin family serine protease